jgi:hypothetical protein
MKVKLQRLWMDKNQSTGVLTVINDKGQPIFASLALERGERNNQQSVSNVPAGIYPLILEHSAKFNQKLYELKNVPKRAECKIHAANMWHQLNGCIAPGLQLKDIDKDGYFDVTDSKNTLDAFHVVLKGIDKTTIEILNPV